MTPTADPPRIDHLVCVTGRLGEVVREYRRSGFAVRAGGRHSGQPTRNALVPLAGGIYVELLGPTHRWVPGALRVLRRTPLWGGYVGGRPIRERFVRLLATGRGLADFCLAIENVDALVGRARAAGVAVSDPAPMERRTAEGRRVAWRLVVPDDPFLPFFIQDETPRDVRVPPLPSPGEHLRAHVRAVTLSVPDPPAAREGLAALLEVTPEAAEDGAACFHLADAVIRIAQDPVTELAHRLTVSLGLVDGQARPAMSLPRGFEM